MKKQTQLFLFLATIGIFLTGVALAFSVPDPVTNVQFSIQEDVPKLSWDAADDADGIVIGYKIYYGTTSVQNVGDAYDDEITVPGNLTATTLEMLEIGVQYFVAVTAIDDEENQSENYSTEISVLIPAEELPEEITPMEESEIILTTPPVENIDTPEIIETPPETEIFSPEDSEKEYIDGQEVFGPFFPEPEKPAAPPDFTAPLDATDLQIRMDELDISGDVQLQWKKSPDIDNDVADQVLYVKKGDGDWDTGYSIGKDLEALELEINPEENYFVRIVTVDIAGNESAGVTFSFSTKLVQSGPGMGALLGGFVIFVAFLFFVNRRRNA